MRKATSLMLALVIALLGVPAALAAETEDTTTSTASVSFEDTGTLELIDPEEDEELGITFGNMNIAFGLKEIPRTNANPYPAIERDGLTHHGVVVSDNRGAADADWTLTVEMPDPFEHEDIPGAVFHAMILLSDGTVSSSHNTSATLAGNALSIETGEDAIPVMRGNGVGNGAYYATWAYGDISLTLGDDFTGIQPGAYEATLVWTVGPTVNP